MNRVLVALLLLTACVPAADTRITGPVLGYAVDAAGVRPVYGIPGAALLGPAADLGGQVLHAATANEAGLVVAVLEDGRVVVLSAAGAADLEDAIPAPSRILLSPKGRAALLYSGESRTLQIITGLNGAPKASGTSTLNQPAEAMAISDNGRALIAAGGTLWSVTPGRAPAHVMHAAGVTAIAFFPGTNDSAFADGGTLYTSRSGRIEAAGELPGTIALQASPRALYAATPEGVTRFDLATGERSELRCDCKVTALEPMRGGGVFRLNEGGSEPLYLYDGGAGKPRIVFVPAAVEGGSL